MVSLAFWLGLFVAVGLYGAVSLSPKLLAMQKQRREYVGNQVELVRMESRVGYLKRVANVMEHDPEFANELARVEFDVSRPGDERIPVDRELTMAAYPSEKGETPVVSPPIYEPMVRMFAENTDVRRWSLISACVIVIVAFTFLHESQTENLQRVAVGVGQFTNSAKNGVGGVFNRYRKSTRQKTDVD
jgi:hypothetical protein